MSPRTESVLTHGVVIAAAVVVLPLAVLAWAAILGHDGAARLAERLSGRPL